MNRTHYFLVFVFLLVLVAQIAVAESSVPTTNLVAHYPYSGNANDASGNGHHGTVYGATLTPDRFGNPEGAFHFTSSLHNYIRIPDHPQLQISTNLTISVWMKHAPSAGNYEDIVMKGNDSYGFQFNSPSNDVLFHLKSSGGSWRNLSSGHNPVLDEWFNVTGTYDGVTQRVYINGTQTNSTNWSGSIATNGDPLDFGNMVAGDNAWYNGELDDFRIYDRVLSASEVMDLYGEYNPYLAPPLDLNIQYSSGNVSISWTAVSGADFYRVYSSDTPDTGFSLDESGVFEGSSWTAPAGLPRKFFLVRAVEE